MKGKLRMSPYRKAREELLSGRDAIRIQAMADLEAAIRADQRRIDAEPAPDGDELTREELQGLVDELGTQAYRAEDVLAFIGEMCDAADTDGSEVTTARVRSWLTYTGCGGAIVLPEDMQEQVAAALGVEALRTPATQVSDVASEDEADEPDDGSGFRCPYCAGPTTYQAMSGGREWFCPACETTGDYPADQTPVRAALLRTEEGRVALREQVRQHLAGLRQQGVARPATPGDLP